MMEPNLNAPAITQFLPTMDGKKQNNWRSERLFSALKICPACGAEFKPWIKKDDSGKVISAMSEPFWKKQNYCSVKCAKKSHPTVLNAEARKRMRETLKRIRHQPIQRGGNGQLLPLPQLALLHALGEGWIAEYAIKTKAGHLNGTYPNAYKVDICYPEKMICIELDGGSHGSEERKMQDRKKDQYLAGLGWRVYRVSNEKALYLYSTFKSVDILLTSLME
jgi:hypothetical protein